VQIVCCRRRTSIPRLAPVKYTQHHKPLAIDAILKHVGGVEHLQHDLAVFFSAPDGSRPSRGCSVSICTLEIISFATVVASDGYFSSRNSTNRSRHDLFMRSGRLLRFKSLPAVGESLVRPLDLHRSRQRRKAGVPQVWSHAFSIAKNKAKSTTRENTSYFPHSRASVASAQPSQ
jgi:hypothetical protein